MTHQMYRSAFVPHDIKATIFGAPTGPLAGLTAAVKDMYAIAGERMGCGNPDWLANHEPAVRNCPPVQKILDAAREHYRQNDLRRIFLQRDGHQRSLRHAG